MPVRKRGPELHPHLRVKIVDRRPAVDDPHPLHEDSALRGRELQERHSCVLGPFGSRLLSGGGY
ncbi:hypothetical protein [Streptomyces agglomeratus]|uniref:hypothetical protein n=1 Tax=Streptomyces agglomeratus TaxID=285458 RepID=UPI0014288D73|nr:hypothetical protein [Streptomyces agglomeratus]